MQHSVSYVVFGKEIHVYFKKPEDVGKIKFGPTGYIPSSLYGANTVEAKVLSYCSACIAAGDTEHHRVDDENGMIVLKMPFKRNSRAQAAQFNLEYLVKGRVE